jgi:hypothetical protein
MDRKTKTVDARVRRMAARQGLELRRSPRRDLNASDYGLYSISSPDGNAVADRITPGRRRAIPDATASAEINSVDHETIALTRVF